MLNSDANNNTVYISHDDVRTVLDTMINPTTPWVGIESLSSLALVDRFLSNPDLPALRNMSNLPIYEIIISIVTDELLNHRRILSLPLPSHKHTAKEYEHNITLDVQTNSTELLYWSLLYHCYVRVDLNISIERFAKLAMCAVRTVRRYRQYAVEQLTHSLMQAEWEARAQFRKRSIHAQFPNPINPVRLLSREDDLKNIQKIIGHNPTSTLLITGSPGIGKTALIQEFLRTYIEDGQETQLEHLIWLDEPDSVDYVYSILYERLTAHNSAIKLREWMTVYRLAIVIDNAHYLLDNHADFDRLLRFLSPALVFIANRTHIVTDKIDACLVLNELNETDVHSLAESAYQRNALSSDIITPDEVLTIQEIAGGNPQAIIMAAQNMAKGYHGEDHVFHHVFDDAHSKLTTNERQLWYLLVLCPPQSIREVDIARLWPRIVKREHFSTLMRNNLLEIVSTRPVKFRLFAVTRNYIARLYVQSSECLDRIHNLVASVHLHAVDCPYFALDVMSYMSGLKWLKISRGLKKSWLDQLAVVGFDSYDRHKWYSLVSDTFTGGIGEVDSNGQIAQGIVLRRLAHWGKAIHIFRKIIADTGSVGEFILQAQAQIELGITLRYCGKYEEAFTNLDHAEQTGVLYGKTHILDAINLEKAQIAVDMRDGKLALLHLSKIQGKRWQEIRYLLLLGESFLLTEQFDEFGDQMRQALALADNDRYISGSIHDLLGRRCLMNKDYDSALHQFSVSISCFSLINEPFALARALSNLGAALIGNEGYDEAKSRLKQAQRIQIKLGDKVGLMITELNLSACMSLH